MLIAVRKREYRNEWGVEVWGPASGLICWASRGRRGEFPVWPDYQRAVSGRFRTISSWDVTGRRVTLPLSASQTATLHHSLHPNTPDNIHSHQPVISQIITIRTSYSKILNYKKSFFKKKIKSMFWNWLKVLKFRILSFL